MPKPLPHRLDRSSYPFAVAVATRFGDLDPQGHVNNVSVARLFEEARFRFNMAHDCKPAVAGLSTVMVSVQLDFLGETLHPSDVEICCGISQIGASSWHIHQLGLQNGAPVAVCSTVFVCFGDKRAQPVPDVWRSGMTQVMMRVSE